MLSTNRKLLAAAIGAILAAAAIGGCTGMVEGPRMNGGAGASEHGAGGESGGEGGSEESGASLTLDDTFDMVRNGARLILRYDRAASAFVGTVENTTNATLQQVRVEVHLSNGVELGPTPPQDLAPGQRIPVTLDATGQDFTGWTPHAEVGPQSGGGGEGGGEHGPGGEGGTS